MKRQFDFKKDVLDLLALYRATQDPDEFSAIEDVLDYRQQQVKLGEETTRSEITDFVFSTLGVINPAYDGFVRSLLSSGKPKAPFLLLAMSASVAHPWMKEALGPNALSNDYLLYSQEGIYRDEIRTELYFGVLTEKPSVNVATGNFTFPFAFCYIFDSADLTTYSCAEGPARIPWNQLIPLSFGKGPFNPTIGDAGLVRCVHAYSGSRLNRFMNSNDDFANFYLSALQHSSNVLPSNLSRSVNSQIYPLRRDLYGEIVETEKHEEKISSVYHTSKLKPDKLVELESVRQKMRELLLEAVLLKLHRRGSIPEERHAHEHVTFLCRSYDVDISDD